MKNNVIIELVGVSKVYDETTAVDNFNFYVKKGEFVSFLGPSGCGKTTTLRMIAGFERPTEGKILLNGEDISDLPPYERPVNTVFQKYALFPHLDVYDNVAFGLKLKKVPVETVGKNGEKVLSSRKLTRREISQKVKDALKIVDLEEFESRDISTLSGGQQQRIAIARAIVNEPQILLLDEPLGALDLKMRKEMQLELKEMHKKLGITFIYVTHDQEEALTMSDTIVVMKDGRIQQIGTPEDIYNEPKNAFVADFIGESNLYEGTYMGNRRVRFLNHIFECVDDFAPNEKVTVVVRPEDVKFAPAGQGMIDGMLVSKVFKGIHYEYTVMVGRNEVTIQSTKNMQTDVPVSINVAPDLIHIMKKGILTNVYDDAYIDNENRVIIAGGAFECDVTQLIRGSTLDEEGYVVAPDGKKYDFKDADVLAEVSLPDIEIIDNEEDGTVCGRIVSMIYIGNHYQVVIRTEDDEDFVVDTEYTWNEDDRVSVRIAPEKIRMTLRGEASKYVKN